MFAFTKQMIFRYCSSNMIRPLCGRHTYTFNELNYFLFNYQKKRMNWAFPSKTHKRTTWMKFRPGPSRGEEKIISLSTSLTWTRKSIFRLALVRMLCLHMKRHVYNRIVVVVAAVVATMDDGKKQIKEKARSSFNVLCIVWFIVMTI